MRFLKLSVQLVQCILLLTVWACTEENIEERQTDSKKALTKEIPQTNTTARAVKRVYHFLRFNITDYNRVSSYIDQIDNLARNSEGKLLTSGKPIRCMERACPERTLVLEFPNVDLGRAFFNNYLNTLAYLQGKVTKDFNYSVGNASDSNANSDSNIQVYSIFSTTITDIPKYIADYVPTAVKVSNRYQGRPITAGLTDCLVGNCTSYTVMVGYRSGKTFLDRYYDREYRPVIPIRERITRGGGLLYTQKEG